MELCIRLCLILVGLFVFQCHADEQPVVNIPFLGSLRGSEMVSASGRKFNAFRGIPYAQPPVGDLRFNVCNGN